MGKAKKISITLVSMMLVVGCVVGAVVMVRNRDMNAHDHAAPAAASAGAGAGSGTTSTSTKTVEAICAPTQFKDSCIASLSAVANKPDASIKDYLEAAVQATLDEVKKAMDVTDKVVVDKTNDPTNDKMGVDDCKVFLQQTVEQLDAAISEVGKSDIQSINKRIEEFIAYLTGAYIYQHTCVDELDKEEYKSVVEAGLKNATQLTDNALYIFSKINEAMGGLELPAGLSNIMGNSTNKVSRRLLSDEVAGHAVDDSRFPQWVSFADRKLLGVHHGKGKGKGKGRKRGGHKGRKGRKGPAGPLPVPLPVPLPIPVPVGPGVKPNVVVAQDGSGQFRTLTDAVNTVPKGNAQRFIIYIKAGIYNEVVQIKAKDNIYLVGDGIGRTIITGNLSFKKGVKTSATATVGVDSDFFMARGITFENSAGADEHQAVALRINGEKAVVFECEMRGYQDTLYYHKGLQFYKNCIISGTVDFIFGNGRAIIQDSTIVARNPGPSQSNMLTADGGLSPVGQHGLVLQNCNIVAEPQLFANRGTVKTYLGRPWKEFAVTVFMQSDIGDFIFPAGYSIFTNVGPGSTNQNTAIYGEYLNRGPGANVDLRDRQTFKNFKVLSPQEAAGYTVGSYIQGPAWLPASGVPFKVGL